MWVEPWGKVHCSGGLENYVCYHANTGSTVGSITCSVHRLFEINSTKSCNAQNNSWLYLMLYKAITPKYNSLYKSSYRCSLRFYLVLILLFLLEVDMDLNAHTTLPHTKMVRWWN